MNANVENQVRDIIQNQLEARVGYTRFTPDSQTSQEEETHDQTDS